LFGLKKKGPSKTFEHADDCKIVKADPDTKIPWNEVETGYWVAECVCGTENHRDPVADRRVRLDPLDPKTSRHARECEFASETDPSVLRVLLKVKPGMGGNYSWSSAAAARWAGRLRTTPRAPGDERWEGIPMKSVGD
jgi:hypothetical protein